MITLYKSLNFLNLSVGDCFSRFEVIQIDHDKILLRDILTETIDYYFPDSLNCLTDLDNTILKSHLGVQFRDSWELKHKLKDLIFSSEEKIIKLRIHYKKSGLKLLAFLDSNSSFIVDPFWGITFSCKKVLDLTKNGDRNIPINSISIPESEEGTELFVLPVLEKDKTFLMDSSINTES